jgi:hypothetical protein
MLRGEKKAQLRKWSKTKEIAIKRIMIKFDINFKWNKMSSDKIKNQKIQKRIQNKINSNKKRYKIWCKNKVIEHLLFFKNQHESRSKERENKKKKKEKIVRVSRPIDHQPTSDN